MLHLLPQVVLTSPRDKLKEALIKDSTLWSGLPFDQTFLKFVEQCYLCKTSIQR
jgi:hypothetical protein